jgi:hypothetical protein
MSQAISQGSSLPASAIRPALATQDVNRAYLRTELNPGDPAWQAAWHELAANPDPLGQVESKQA